MQMEEAVSNGIKLRKNDSHSQRSRERGYILAVILGTISERFNLIWYGTVIAVDAASKGISGIWVGWWLFASCLSAWAVCTFLTAHFSTFVQRFIDIPQEKTVYYLLNYSAILLGFVSCLLGLIGFSSGVFYIVSNFVSCLIRGALSAVIVVSINTVIIMEFENKVEVLKMYNGMSYTFACIFSILVSYAVYQLAPIFFLSTLSTSAISFLCILPVWLTMPVNSTTSKEKQKSSTPSLTLKNSNAASAAAVTGCTTNKNAAVTSNPLKAATVLSTSLTSIHSLVQTPTPIPLSLQSTPGKWSKAIALCKVPEICMALLSQMCIFSGLAAHGPIHSPFLQETFGLEFIYIGLISCSPFLAMALGAFFFGLFGRTLSGRKVSLIGCMFLQGTSMMIEGPDPAFCSLPQSVELHAISLFISAFAFSSHLVLTAEEMRHAAVVHNHLSKDADVLQVSCAIGSLLTASEYASGLVGPLFGGYVGQTLGFGRTIGLMGMSLYVLGAIRLVVLIRQDHLYKKHAKMARKEKSIELTS